MLTILLVVLCLLVLFLLLAYGGMSLVVKRLEVKVALLEHRVDALARLAQHEPSERPMLVHPLDVTIVGREPGRPQ